MPGMKVRMEFARKDEIAFRENERKMLHTSGLGRDRHSPTVIPDGGQTDVVMTDEPSNLARNQKIEEMSFKLEKG